MDVFDRIAEQLEALALPLFAVTLTALPRTNTPVLLMLHWHGFRPEVDLAAGPAPAPVSRHPVAGSALQLNPLWDTVERLDEAMLDAAWRLGAWELDREERRGCERPGASRREAVECRQAFGEDPFGTDRPEHMVTEAQDRDELMHMAARVGYVRWQFRPVRGGIWRDLAHDDTLAEDGGRAPPCPIRARSLVGPRVSRVRYRLGRIGR